MDSYVSREIAPLRETQQLARAGTGVVFWAAASQAPRLMDLIGRERELTFGAAGEGTGQTRDLDVFDDRYIHLCAWDQQNDALIGAYRLGVLDAHGGAASLDLLYTSTLFHFDRGLTAHLSPAIELGRAFVRAPYQKRHAALMLLWMGIGSLIARREPRTRHLFGAVSIGATYSPAARALMVAFLKRHAWHAPFARQTMARNPIPAFGSRVLELTGEGVRAAAALVPATPDVDALDTRVRALDREGKGVPVLLRQYLRLGAHAVAFNIDRGFNDALDALVVVDLPRAPASVLRRHMGCDGARAYLSSHQVAAA
jgi:putative hemolysin